MGLDIYAGTFTRYYTRNWKTVNQVFCEQNGFEYRQIRTNDIPPPPADEVCEGVNNWLNQLIRVLGNSGVKAAEPWEENNEKPYYTDKPDWDAFNALLLYAASRLLQKDFPKEFHKNTDISNHPLMKEIESSPQATGWSLFSGACHWIPINDGIMFNFPLANGAAANIGSTALLKYELSKINESGWNANREEILSWVNTEGYPTDAAVENGTIEHLQVNDVYDTESLAKFAFSILFKAVEFSEKERVPVILDF